METVESELASKKGAFTESLVRNNKKIREDRAIAISEEAEMKYKRVIEDMQIKLRQLRRDRDNMLDLSPTNADSLVLASDFKSDVFIEKDIQLSVDMRNLEIKLDIARERYNYLFTDTNQK